jgi:hypothetical protein
VFAYFDESGKFQKSDFVCIAGFAAFEGQWDAFAPQWERLLKHHNIPAMHMRELFSFTGPFQGWGRERAKNALTEFIDVIKQNMMFGFGVGMDTKYLKTMPTDIQKKIGDPQYFCFQRILTRIVNKMKEWNYNGPIAIAFDDSEEHSVRCYRMWSKLRKLHPELKRTIPAISFGDADVLYPLQAADVLAHQTRDHQLRMSHGRSHSQHFENLVTPVNQEIGIHYDSEFWNKDLLEDIHGQFQRGEVRLL